ncbi:MAG: hypothetical protein ABI488_13375, partial [Polyangiaceae bacterium]
MSEPNDPNKPGRPTTGPGRASSIGNELGDDLDFEPDALLDGLLFDDATVAAVPTPLVPARHSANLHQPEKREYSEDDVTVVGRTEDLFAGVAVDDGTTGLEDLAGSDIDELLASMPPSAASEPATSGSDSHLRLPDIPAAPRLPTVPAAVPRPLSRLGSSGQRPSTDATAKPPAVNPAGPPARQPFPPAVSPRAPNAGLSSRDSAAKFAAPRTGGIVTSSKSPSSVPPSPAPLQEAEDEEERTRVYFGRISEPSIEPPPSPSTAAPTLENIVEAAPALQDDAVLPDPFFATSVRDSDAPLSNMPTLQQVEPPSRLPTLSVPEAREAREMPSIPGPESIPATSLADGEFELFPETPADYGAVSSDRHDEPQAQLSLAPPPSDTELLSPIPERPSLAPSIWPDERPARDHLNGQEAAFIARAEWLEREAHAASDPQAKVRALIVASELWALLGDLPRAREVASEASAIPRAPTMAARQLRTLAAAEGDFKAVAPALEMEIRGAATVEARVHAAYLSAEVHRLSLQDEAGAKKKLDLAVRAHQDDPRAHLAKLADLLGRSSGPARVRFPESEALTELVRASEELLRLRGAPAAAGSTPLVPGPRSAFDDARRALSAGDREKAADALDRLSHVEGLGNACAWLSACLLGADPKTRARAITGLSELAANSG